MAASENAYGENHFATYVSQPEPESRLAELSAEAFGENQFGFPVPATPPKPVFESENSRWDG